jgi:hypothetical protein
MAVTAIVRTDDGGDDPRDELSEAIAEAKQARAELDRHREALDRARSLVRQGAARVEAAVVAVAQAQETDAAALVGAIVAGAPSSVVGAARKARIAEDACRDEVAAAEAAYGRLRVDVSGIAAEAERAERAVDAAVGGVLQPVARRLLDEARNLRLEFLKRIYAVDTMRALLPADLVAEKERLLTFISPELMAASATVQKDWRTAIEALKGNPDAPLPGSDMSPLPP